ncbi:MAG: NAD(P)-binding protein [Acidimicrobiales bacterium]
MQIARRRGIALALAVLLLWSVGRAGVRGDLVNPGGWPEFSTSGEPSQGRTSRPTSSGSPSRPRASRWPSPSWGPSRRCSSAPWEQQASPRSSTWAAIRSAWRIALVVPRAIHEILWALLLVQVFGFDPVVAVIAIAVPFGAVTAKVFAETIDAADPGPFRALRAAGAAASALFYGVVPGIRGELLSYAFYRFECAIRTAAVLGIVGVGGLGFQLDLSFSSLHYDEIWTLIAALMLLSGLADAVSTRVRRHRPRHPGGQAGRAPRRRSDRRVVALGGNAPRRDPGSQAPSGRRSPRRPSAPRLGPGGWAELARATTDTVAMSVLALTIASVGGLVLAIVGRRGGVPERPGAVRRAVGLSLLLFRAVPAALGVRVRARPLPRYLAGRGGARDLQPGRVGAPVRRGVRRAGPCRRRRAPRCRGLRPPGVPLRLPPRRRCSADLPHPVPMGGDRARDRRRRRRRRRRARPAHPQPSRGKGLRRRFLCPRRDRRRHSRHRPREQPPPSGGRGVADQACPGSSGGGSVPVMSDHSSTPSEEFDVVIVGAGISGVGAAHHLVTQRPETSFVVLESQAGFGGTWRTHRYPGIRSDSDLYTFGYRFKPWTGAPIATAEEILRYMGEVIADHDLGRFIRYGRTVIDASWSTETRRWTLTVTDGGDGATTRLTTGFLWMCQGYYRHSEGYTPEWPGMDRFAGDIVHPQTWPDGLDYTGKKVVVIGSGATAATLIPAMVPDVEHITMLQRSPTFFLSGRNSNDLADTLRELEIPEEWIHEIVRRKILHDQEQLTIAAREHPEFVRQEMLNAMRAELPEGYDVETHFNPRYRPWQQRIAFVPDGDLFKGISSGKASVVTDEIETFTESGIRLQSGATLDADLIVTATGFDLNVLGDIAFRIDGIPLRFGDSVTYRGAMFTGVPNLVWVFGYFRASWTLRADLLADFVCSVLDHMDATGASMVVPALRSDELDMELHPWVEPDDFNPGYLARGMHLMPRQGDRMPWRHTQDYWRDKVDLPAADLTDGTLRFE